MPSPGPCVLLVEDDRDLREALAEIITDAGYSVLTAANGPDALALAAEHPPTFVLLDLRMPGMDGHETLLALRQLPEHIPVVFMSAGLRAREAAAQDDTEGFLEKPFGIDELLRVVARFCA
jgi:CheY-like chemotaxis protein